MVALIFRSYNPSGKKVSLLAVMLHIPSACTSLLTVHAKVVPFRIKDTSQLVADAGAFITRGKDSP